MSNSVCTSPVTTNRIIFNHIFEWVRMDTDFFQKRIERVLHPSENLFVLVILVKIVEIWIFDAWVPKTTE